MRSLFARSRGASRASGDRPIVVVDVGARWGVGARWAALAPDLRVYGFDPDPEECARLNAQAAAEGETTTTYVPIALGPRTGDAELHATVEPACSSLYPPVVRLSETLPELACIAPVGSTSVRLQPLDDWAKTNKLDYVDAMKIDTQGSELGVLQGAERILSTVQLLEIEVEFNPIYEGQPLFGDVDAFLRDRGFMLWQLDNLVHYSPGGEMGRVEKTTVSFYDSVPKQTEGRGGQLYWAHAYYVPARLCPGTAEQPTQEQALRAAAVARTAGLLDLAVGLEGLSQPQAPQGHEQANKGRPVDGT